MLKIQSDCLFPVSDNPVPKGILVVSEQGLIQDIIDPENIDYNLSDVQYFSGIICPGFVNTHCHLELSYLKNKIDKNNGLNNFILQLQIAKAIDKDEIFKSISEMDEQMYMQGTVAVADISNTTDTINAKSKSKIHYHNFVELFGSDPEYADLIFEKGKKILSEFEQNVSQCKSSLTPHSLYGVSKKLLKNITNHAKKRNDIFSFHYLESQEENDYFINKTGSIPERMKYFNVDISSFKPTGKSSLETLCQCLPQNSNILLVHNIYASQNDIEFALEKIKNLWWCLCPDSNLFIENKLPDINLLFNNKCKLTIGTDSHASNHTLNVLEEFKTIQKHTNISTNELLKMATLNGAKYMNINKVFGSFEKNKKPGMVLIKNVNPENFYLTDKSEAVRITF